MWPKMGSWEECDLRCVPCEECDPRCVPWEECDRRCVPWEECDPRVMFFPWSLSDNGKNMTPNYLSFLPFPTNFLLPRRFAQSLEQACIDVVDSGKMTKDLAGCIHGLRNVKDGMYMYTQDFLEAISEDLAKKMSAWGRRWGGTGGLRAMFEMALTNPWCCIVVMWSSNSSSCKPWNKTSIVDSHLKCCVKDPIDKYIMLTY